MVVYDRALTGQDVAALYGQPLLAMHLDEPPGAIIFAEDGGLTGTCTHATTARGRQAGAVRQSVCFSGQAVSLRCRPFPPLESQFTMAAWVLPARHQYDTRRGSSAA